MSSFFRFATVAGSILLCLIGVFLARSQSQKGPSDSVGFSSMDSLGAVDDYQFASSRAPALTFQELETIIRRDPTAKQQHGKIEFGSVRLEEGTALAEVMFVSNDGRVLPFQAIPFQHLP